MSNPQCDLFDQPKDDRTAINGDCVLRRTDECVVVFVKEKLKKHHVTRLRLSMPSVLDYWVNDAQGDPLFVFSGCVRKGMVPVLREIIRELRDAGEQRVITLVFDREGWSPSLFAELNAMEGIRFVTYRKAGRGKRLPHLSLSNFEEHTIDWQGQQVRYELAARHWTTRSPLGRRCAGSRSHMGDWASRCGCSALGSRNSKGA